MICYLRNSDSFIDLSNPIPGKMHSSIYPFGFTVLSDSKDWSNCHPDRCEYLLDRLIDPKPLMDFLANWQFTHPELCI